jgi:hypothetical protein
VSEPKTPHQLTSVKSCDFGIDRPVEGVEIAWDRERDVVYVIGTIKRGTPK